MPALAVVLWLLATLAWWAFAFMPLPTAPPEWLQAARYICFGPMPTGWPDAAGWIMLVVAPLTFLAALGALWGRQVVGSLAGLGRSRAGQALLAALALLIVVEGGWVAVKVRTARQLTGADASPASLPAALPADYPRQTAAAPDFALVDQDGATVALSRFRGRPVVVTFVFAHCQALCPMIVESLKGAAAGAGGADVLLVTLDPWRDTPSALPAIARQWKMPSGFHVLSARRAADVLRVVEAYGVPAQRDEKTGDIAHPGVVFVVDGDGRLAYTFNNPPAAWVREALHRLRRPDRTVG